MSPTWFLILRFSNCVEEGCGSGHYLELLVGPTETKHFSFNTGAAVG